MKEINYSDLLTWVKENKDFQLIDVREPEEHSYFNIGGDLMPLGEIVRRPDKIDTDKPVVVYCKRGIRSQLAIQRLKIRLPHADFYNLTNGIYDLMYT